MVASVSRLVAVAWLGALGCAALGSQAAPKTVTTKLSNGATLIVREDHTSPIAAIAVFVRAGSARELQANSGVAHILEHLAYSGTANRPGNQLMSAAEKLGYTLEAKTEKELTTFDCACLSRDWKDVFGLVADAVVNLAPTTDAFRSVQRVVMQEYFAHRDSPIEFTPDRLFRIAFGDAGYGLPTGGLPDSLQKLMPDDVNAFRRDWYTTGNTFITVVGDVPAAKVKEEAENWFGGMPRSAGMSFAAPASPAPKTVDEKGAYTQAAVALAFPAPGGADRVADTAIVDSLVTLLQVRLSAESFRKDALAVRVQYMTLSQPSLVTSVVFCDEAKLATVRAAVDAEIKRLSDGAFTEAEFTAARNRTLAHVLYDIETCEGMADALGYWAAAGGAGAFDSYVKTLRDAKYADGKRVAAEVFDARKQIRLVWHAGGGS